MPKKYFDLNKSVIISAAVLLIANLLIIQLPLFGTLGYEFAAINALFLSVICGLLTISYQKKNVNVTKSFVLSLLSLSLIPLFISIIYSFITLFCSFYDGLLFYVLIVFPAITAGTGSAILISHYIKRFTRTSFVILIFIIALIPFFEIYFNPQVYFYSPLIGYFPGNIYDEGLSPDWKLFFHQLIIILFFSLIAFMILKQKKIITSYKYYFVSAIIFIVILFQFASSYLEFTSTFSTLNAELPKQIETNRICLHYDKLEKSEAEFIAISSEYYFDELKNSLKVEPSKKINIYLFNDREQKKNIFGAGNADVAKPWQYTVYISADSWQSTLKHELAHIFSAEFGNGVFKLAAGFNPAIIEGLPESIDGIYDEFNIDDITALAFNNNFKIDIQSLYSGLNFFKSNSVLSYTYSGSFFKYLIRKYGIEKVKLFYSSGEYEDVFKSNLRTDKVEFENILRSDSSLINSSAADYYFGRLSIIQKVCPRFISDRLSSTWNELDDAKLDIAEKLFLEINDKAINYSALIGLSEIYLIQKKQLKGIRLLKSELKYFEKTPYYYNLKFRIADLYAMNNDIDSAKHNYEDIIKAKPHYALEFLSYTRLSLLSIDRLKDYIEGDDSTKYKTLLELNSNEYNYNSIPVLLNLIEELKIDYHTVLQSFNRTFIVSNIESSFAAYQLSKFMLKNGDYSNARKYSALSLRHKEKNPFIYAMNENFRKANWFYKDADKILLINKSQNSE